MKCDGYGPHEGKCEETAEWRSYWCPRCNQLRRAEMLYDLDADKVLAKTRELEDGDGKGVVS